MFLITVCQILGRKKIGEIGDVINKLTFRRDWFSFFIMPRTGRLHAPGVLHHVMVRGIEQGVIFQDDEDRSRFRTRMGRVFDRILVAQAQLENLSILTADPRIARYPVKVVW